MIDTPKLLMLVIMLNLMMGLTTQAISKSTNESAVLQMFKDSGNKIYSDANKMEQQTGNTTNGTLDLSTLLRQTGTTSGNAGESITNLGNIFGVIGSLLFSSTLPYIQLFSTGFGYLNTSTVTGTTNLMGVGLILLGLVVFLINLALYIRVIDKLYAKYQG